MFLSVHVSRFETNGSLVVDLRGEGGPVVRYGPYGVGMPWHRWNGGEWVETAFDWGARIVNKAHESRNDLPVLRYLRSWPPRLIASLHPVWYGQSTVLQLCALYPAARDLARTNLVLLWLAAARYAEDGGWRVRLPEMLALPQRHLLAATLDQHEVRPAQVRFLRKIVLMEGPQAMLNRIREVVADRETVMALRHWPRLPSSLVPIAAGPLLRNLHWLRDHLAATANPWLLGWILDGRLDMLVDTSRMLQSLVPGSADRLVTQSCRDWDGVKHLHDALVEVWTAEEAGHDGSGLDPGRYFGPPPIPSDDDFQAITTVGDLQKEGRLMHHCVSARTPDVLAGYCYIYRVNIHGERGTLQVGMGSEGLVIDEFRLRNNDSPSPEAWAAARAWVKRSGRGNQKAG